MYQPRKYEWFKERIGTIVYRDRGKYCCTSCEDVVDNGIEVHDENHAQYLFDIQNEFLAEGIVLDYRDEK